MAGDIAVRRFDFEFARTCYERALELSPTHWTTWSNLAGVARYLHDLALHERAVEQAVAFCPDRTMRARLRGGHLVYMHANPAHDAGALFRRISEAVAADCKAATFETPLMPRRPGAPLRVAFVSGNFSGPIHSTLLPGLVGAFDLARIRLTLVDSKANAQDRPRWLPSQVPYIHVPGAYGIRGMFDIAVDLDGHAPGGSPLSFAERLAPVQVSWLDWFNTTGLPNMDYWLGDSLSTPVGAEPYFTERLWRLPHFRLPYRPHPALASLPTRQRRENEPIVFGVFGRIDKYHPGLLDAWTRILQAAPKTKLLLKAAVFDAPRFQMRYRKYFAERGIAADRILLLGKHDYLEHLASFSRIDLLLDTFPYNGGVTTFDALSMGVPVLSVWGDTPVSRQSASLMTELGFEEFAVVDATAYVARAIEIAHDPDRHLPPPAVVRERLLKHPSCDGSRFAESLIEALEAIWDDACARRSQQLKIDSLVAS
ncbi:MAG: hypothetical protein N3F11_01615 [Casimicrobiaceae bacterium]|nr:hypothetical protein [Casimicrobiaceae bacterium]